MHKLRGTAMCDIIFFTNQFESSKISLDFDALNFCTALITSLLLISRHEKNTSILTLFLMSFPASSAHGGSFWRTSSTTDVKKLLKSSASGATVAPAGEPACLFTTCQAAMLTLVALLIKFCLQT